MNAPTLLKVSKKRYLTKHRPDIQKSAITEKNTNGRSVFEEKVNINELVKNHIGEEAFSFLQKYVDFEDEKTLVEATATRFNFLKIPVGKYRAITNLKRVNDIRWINKYFETVNTKLDSSDIFIGFVETKKKP